MTTAQKPKSGESDALTRVAAELGLSGGVIAPEQVAALERLVGAGFFMVDAERNIRAFGPEMERLTGFAAEEVLGRHCLSALRCEQCLQSCGVFTRGSAGPAEISLYRRDGTPLQVEKSGTVLRDEDGVAVMTLEMLRPLRSGRGEGAAGDDEAAGSAGADRLLLALGRYFVAADREGRIVRFSERLPGFLGLEAIELARMRLADVFGEELFAPGGPFMSAVLKGERREGWRALVRKADGELLPVSISAAPVGATEGAEPTTGCHPTSAILVVLRPEREAAEGAAADVGFEGMVARSPAMHQIFRLIELLRDSDATVLVTGASGTGKEMVARAIHQRSHRAAGPFVAVNCGALPGELLESELFGHVRGAFTGAVRDTPGRFELADGGTLLLDEIGDLSLPLQVKLLRALQERSFERVGDTRTRNVDVRVVAATNVDLAQAVAERLFRDDLYYRLRVVPIEIPPLRERREDVEPLANHLLARIGLRRGRSLRFSPTAMRSLLAYDWPGNVRELENALEYATAICEGQTIHQNDLPEEVALGKHARFAAPTTPAPVPTPAALPPRSPSPDADAGDERAHIAAALEQTRYKRQAAAELLGISRWTLWRKMKEHGLG